VAKYDHSVSIFSKIDDHIEALTSIAFDNNRLNYTCYTMKKDTAKTN